MTLCPVPVAPPTDDHPLIGNLTDCKYFGLFGTDSSSLANLVPGGDAVTQIGTPTFGADFMATHSNAAVGLKTIQLPASCIPQEGDDLWIIALATRATSGAYLSSNGLNANGQSIDENGLFAGGDGPRFKNGQLSDVGQAEGVWPSTSATNFFFMSGYGQDRGHSFIEVGSGGSIMARLGGSATGDRKLRAESAPLIFNPDAEGNIAINVAALAVFHRMPLLTENATICAAMTPYFNGRGDIVVE